MRRLSKLALEQLAQSGARRAVSRCEPGQVGKIIARSQRVRKRASIVAEVEEDREITVTVNGVPHATKLYNGVQRFVPEPAVEKLVKLAIDHMGMRGRAPQNFYHLIPEELKAGTHANPAVNLLVERNKHSYMGLNELAVALHHGEVSLEDYIQFGTLHGYSVAGYEDSIYSVLSNMDVLYALEDEDDEDAYYAEVEKHFKLHNPRWEE